MTSSGMIVSESYVLYAFCDFAAVGCHWICRNFQVERTSCPAASAIRSLCGFLHKGHRTGTIWDHLGRWRTLELAALTGSRDHGLLWLLVHLCVRCSLDLHLTWHGSHTQKCHRKQIGKKKKICERLGQSGSAANDFDGSVFDGLGAMFPMSMACLTQKLAISMLPMALPAQVLGRFLDGDLVVFGAPCAIPGCWWSGDPEISCANFSGPFHGWSHPCSFHPEKQGFKWKNP